MATLRPALRPVYRNSRQHARTQWHSIEHQMQNLRLGPITQRSRNLGTTSLTDNNAFTPPPLETFTPSDPKDHSKDAKPEAPLFAAHARVVPVSQSYFTRQSNFLDNYIQLEALHKKYGRLPAAPPDLVERVAWKSNKDYMMEVNEKIKASLYNKAIRIVKSLNKIHPELKPHVIKDAIRPFRRAVNPFALRTKQIPIDKFGRALGVGRRKTSTARAWVVEGTGEVLVNGKSLSEAFGRIHDRESATWALRSADRVDKYNVWALVDGGGTTGQAEALALACAKAIVAHEPALKTTLRKAGCLTRDARMVERKKHGLLKARKARPFVKR